MNMLLFRLKAVPNLNLPEETLRSKFKSMKDHQRSLLTIAEATKGLMDAEKLQIEKEHAETTEAAADNEPTNIAGLAQFLLGAYSRRHFGEGPLPHGSVNVAMFTIIYLGIAIFVEIVYMFNGGFGVYRHFTKPEENDHRFQFALLLQYVCMLVLMIML